MAKEIKTQKSENPKKALALPFSFSNLEDLRKTLNRYPEDAPGTLFYFMLGKDICSPEMLKEMFGLNDEYLPLVFDENRDVYCGANVRWILEHDLEIDPKTHEFVSIHFSPAQQKLRKLLLKIVLVARFEQLMEDLEEEYGIELYDEYDDLMEENTITEEELLDALNTYQSEHCVE